MLKIFFNNRQNSTSNHYSRIRWNTSASGSQPGIQLNNMTIQSWPKIQHDIFTSTYLTSSLSPERRNVLFELKHSLTWINLAAVRSFGNYISPYFAFRGRRNCCSSSVTAGRVNVTRTHTKSGEEVAASMAHISQLKQQFSWLTNEKERNKTNKQLRAEQLFLFKEESE
jgi:hypothetical protein